MLWRRPSSKDPTTVSGPTQNSRLAVKNASLTVAPEPGGPPARDPLLEAVAEALQARLDADRLADQAAEQDRAEDVQRARVAPGEREVDPDDRGDEPEAGEHPLLQARRQPPPERDADRGAREHRGDVEEGAVHGVTT